MAPTKELSSPLGDLGKLPPELRNEVYKHALTTERPIELSTFTAERIQNWPGGPIRHISDCRGKLLTGRIKGTKRVLTAAGQVLSVHLLRTSKAINAEALPSLYSGNLYQFDTFSTMRMFRVKTLERFAMITQMSIPGIMGVKHVHSPAATSRLASQPANDRGTLARPRLRLGERVRCGRVEDDQEAGRRGNYR